MKKTIAIILAKSAYSTGRILGKSGTALPGLLAEKVDGNLMSKLAKGNFPDGIVVVTGTNGKTTTSKMISDMLNGSGVVHIRNTAGSNMRRGIISTLIQNSNLRGRNKARMAVLEVDEAYVPSVCSAIKPKYVVVTNLFRDQLDRYGELDSIAKSFEKTFAGTKSKLVLNADDPLVASIGIKALNKPIFFGISDYQGDKIINDHTADSVFEQESGEKLQYLQRYFGHIGIYTSKNKKYTRPEPNINLIKMRSLTKVGSDFDVKISTQLKKINISLPGIYNIYNSLAALATTEALGLGVDEAIRSLSKTSSVFGRGESIEYSGRRVKLLLIKNPTGFNQIIQTYLKPKPQSNTLILSINDNIADGRDVSWLWDSALEDLSSYTGKIVVSGSRSYDMALRLKYAGFNMDNIKIANTLKQALDLATAADPSESGIVYALNTYTAMLEMRQTISRSSAVKLKGISK